MTPSHSGTGTLAIRMRLSRLGHRCAGNGSPQQFQLDQHGDFFDWFLVRRMNSPDSLFVSDPSIRRVAHFENWWLYHRKRGSAGPPSETP